MATFTQAFAEFGIKLKNPQGHWSARDGNKVAITMWADRIHDRTYRFSINDDPKERRKPGWHGLVKNVKYALAHCNGEVNTIMIHAQSVAAKRKSVTNECRALKNKWKITHFDEAAGELTMIPL